jgi:hypothetical protein
MIHLVLTIPTTQEIVRTAVLREMRDWMVRLKEKSIQLGEMAIGAYVKSTKTLKAQSASSGSLSSDYADAYNDAKSVKELKDRVHGSSHGIFQLFHF